MGRMAVSAHIAAVVCAAPDEGVPPEWRRAFDGLGVKTTRTLATATPSAGALAKAARDQGLDHLCVLNADADGVRLSLYRALPGGHGELLTAALGAAPADAPSTSLTSALALRLDLLWTAPLGSGAWVPAPPPKPLPPLPPEVALDLASPPRAPWPELPVIDLPTPVTARVERDIPPQSGYELSVDTEPAPVEPDPVEDSRGVRLGPQVTGGSAQPWLALGVVAGVDFGAFGGSVPLTPALLVSAAPFWLTSSGPTAGPLKLALSPLARYAPPAWTVDAALGAHADLWLRLPSDAGQGPTATLTLGPAARVGWTPSALGGVRLCGTAELTFSAGRIGADAPAGAAAPERWTLALDASWPIP